MATILTSRKLLRCKALLCASFSTHATPFPSFRAAKSAILSESDPEKLAAIFDQNSLFPTFRRHRPIYEVSVHKLSHSGRADLVDRILDRQISSPSNAASLKSQGFWIRLMMLYSSAGMVDQAMRTLDRMLQTKCCDISEKSLCASLSVHLNNGLFEKTHELFDKMPQRLGVEPGVVSHYLILKTFVKQNKVELAREWVQKMDKEGKVMPTIDSYNILLVAYWVNRDSNGFDGVLKEMMSKGLEPNATTYVHRIAKMCKDKECVRAKKLLDEMISKGVHPNSATYNTIIHGFCKVGDLDSAKKVVQSMLIDGYAVPSSSAYYALMRGAVKEGEFDLALEMCREIMRRKWVPPYEAMEGLVNGLLRMSRMGEAKEVIEKMKRKLKGNAVESWAEVEAAFPL